MSSSSRYLAEKKCCNSSIIGSKGPQGSQGLSGSQGLQGLTGHTGSQGPQGSRGIGQRGPQGPQGPPFGSNYLYKFTIYSSANFTYNNLEPEYQEIPLINSTVITLPSGTYSINWSFRNFDINPPQSYVYISFVGTAGTYTTNVFTETNPCPLVTNDSNNLYGSGSETFTIGENGDTIECHLYFKANTLLDQIFNYRFNLQMNPNPVKVL
jgi:hypothetical protein